MASLKSVELSHVRHIKEWEDGCDELEDIPHSFQLEMGAGITWSIFTDNQEQKVSYITLYVVLSL